MTTETLATTVPPELGSLALVDEFLRYLLEKRRACDTGRFMSKLIDDALDTRLTLMNKERSR